MLFFADPGAVMIQDLEADLFSDKDPFDANDDAPTSNNRDGDDGALDAENQETDEAAETTKRKRLLKPRPKLDVDRLFSATKAGEI